MAMETEELEPVRREVEPRQLALIAGAVVLLLLIVWFFFLRSSGPSTPAVPATAPVTVASPAVTSPSPAAAPAGRHHPVQTFQVFAPRDPFKPLVSAATGTTSGTTTTGGTGTTGSGGSGGGTSSGGTSSSSGGRAVSGHRVKLVDTFTQNGGKKAEVEVDGTVYRVGPGQTFADNFKLLSISGKCASLLFGDDQFSLCEGQEVLK
jgi:hypothetical protein